VNRQRKQREEPGEQTFENMLRGVHASEHHRVLNAYNKAVETVEGGSRLESRRKENENR